MICVSDWDMLLEDPNDEMVVTFIIDVQVALTYTPKECVINVDETSWHVGWTNQEMMFDYLQ
jgi:hypothetical protein